MSYLSIGEFAEAVGKTTQTIRNWDNSGYLKSAKIGLGGHRYYTQEQVDKYLGKKSYIKEEFNYRKIIGYCRVSTQKQKENLDRQVECVRSYCAAHGYQFEIITDIGSGINYDKKGLNTLIEEVLNNNVEKVVIMYKDRLVRFGFSLLQNIFNHFNTEIEIIDNTEKTEQEELIDDLVQIITVFGARISGKRAHKAKEIVEQLKGSD